MSDTTTTTTDTADIAADAADIAAATGRKLPVASGQARLSWTRVGGKVGTRADAATKTGAVDGHRKVGTRYALAYKVRPTRDGKAWTAQALVDVDGKAVWRTLVKGVGRAAAYYAASNHHHWVGGKVGARRDASA